MDTTDQKTVLICARTKSLRMNLEASLTESGYAVVAVTGYAEVIASLQAAPREALVCEIRRDEFAKFLKAVVRLRAAMPVHLIDHNKVFCFYPLQRQPFALIDAIMAAGITVSPDLLRHTHGERPRPVAQDATFMV
jgi:CheY-like chemotaxis protein